MASLIAVDIKAICDGGDFVFFSPKVRVIYDIANYLQEFQAQAFKGISSDLPHIF